MSPHKSKKRLCIVELDWPVPTFIHNLIDGLLKQNVEITIACSKQPDPMFLKHPDFHWLKLPSSKQPLLYKCFQLSLRFLKKCMTAPSDLGFILNHIKQKQNIKNKLNELNRFLPYCGQRWDVFYFPWNGTAVDYLHLYSFSNRVIISCRGSQINIATLNPKRQNYTKQLEHSFEKAHTVHCVSQAILEKAKQFGCQEEKSKIIHPAVDVEKFKPLKQKPSGSTFKVITVSSLVWVKGYEYALQAFKKIIDQGVQAEYTIIGNGTARQRVQFSIMDMGLENHVKLKGALKPQEVLQELQQSDVFLFSSLSEGISNAVIEAMSCECAVISSDCGGMPELIEDTVDGFIVPKRDPDRLAMRLLELYKNQDLRKQLGEAARQKVLKSFQFKQQVQDFHHLFEEQLKG